MRIAMISDLETSGGAAIAASRLAARLAEAGAEIVRCVRFADGRSHRWRTMVVAPPRRPRGLYGKILRSFDTWREGGHTAPGLRAILRDAAADVINVHNIHAADWGLDVIETCIGRAPTAWTLHDMWSFSGRCAYSYDCQKYLSGCDAACPTPDEYPTLAPPLIGAAWQRRRCLLDGHPSLMAVCPSRWLAETARAGLWKGHRIEVVPYGVPLETYAPVDRAQARAALGLPADGPIVSFAANLLSERRKGADILTKALAAVKTRPLTLLVLGRGDLVVEIEGITVRPLGFVEDERARAMAFSAADVMIHPAPVDNLPNVVMETIACGTPCVAFAVGGVPDMVRPGLTGWLVHDVKPAALAAAIDRAITEVRNGMSLRESCRDIAQREYGDTTQARRYLTLFESFSSHAPPEVTRR